MNRIKNRIICGIVTIALVMSLIPNIGEIKEVEAANTANDVVNIAISQEGYIEKASASMLDDKTANAGSANITKYHRDLGVSYGQAWCAYFVRWVLQTAGVPSSEYPTSGYVPTWQQFYIDRGRYHERGTYIAKPGDLVIIRTSEGPRGHIGIVVLADNVGFFYTSGNTGNNTDRVARSGWMSQTDTKVTGWCEMRYNNDPTPPSISNVRVTMDFDKYTVECDITDNVGINRVRFPSWPSYKSSDGCTWYEPTEVNGNHYKFTLRTEEFNYYGGRFITHIYAYDTSGNSSAVDAKVPAFPQKNFKVSETKLNDHRYELYTCNCGWSDAKGLAESLGGHLVTINSEAENIVIKELIKDGTYDAYWMGATDEGSEGTFRWITGETFYNYGPGSFDNAGGNENWLGIWNGKWNDFPKNYCDNARIGYIVEYEPEVTESSGILNGHEYVVYKDSLTATEARAKEGNGYHLATITSADEYNFIMNLTKKISKQPEGYWFGANDLTKESVFTWETGEPFIYDLWPDGQPDNNGGSLGDENYFGIWSSGIWNDFPEAYKLGYVLEKDPPVSTASGSLGDHDYKISAAYMTRTEAEQYQTDGWYLATITSSEERDYVVSLISGLNEKNLNGYWLGGSDVGHEGTFTWDNGEEFSYAPWESGEPNNKNRLGQDENYLALLNNGNFNDDNESYCLGEVLERDPESKIIKVDTINLTSDRDETKDSYEDDTFQLTAEVLPEEATDKTVTWSSSDTDYATVDDSGKVKVNSSIPDTIKTIIITASNSDGTVVATYSFVVCPKSSCEHNWNTGTIIKEATCSEYGEMEYTCSKCGTTKLEIIGLKAHTPIDDDEVLATCDKEGKTKGSHCSVCGKVISEQTTVPALGHQFGDYIPNNDETCIANGTATAICERCGKSDSIIIEDSATGIHIWGEYEVTKPATCTEIGIKTRKCINCNKTSSAGIVKAAHEYVDVVTKEPTCTEKGTVTFTCANCGETYDEDIEPLGHNEVPDPAIASTSTSTGLTEGSHCSRCNTVLIEQQVIPKIEECTDHVWGEYEVTTAPTCTAVGVKTRYCQVCGKKSTLGIPIVDHNYVEEVQKESTCGEAGILKKTCSMCGDEKYEAIEKKTHTIVVDSAVAATTTSTGLTEGSHCSLCGTVIKAQEVIPILPDDSYKENNNPDENKQDNDDKINQNNDQTNNPDDNNANTDSSNSNNANTDSSNGSQADGTAGNNSNHYSSEWVDGKWYDANGNQTYEGTLQWKSNSVGWWVEDSAGWYPQNAWQKIDGVWYYFKPDGYMASGEYYNGYWFNGNGSWDSTYKLSWKSNSTGWWVEDISGWWPSSSWLKIDGSWYYFNGSGYMVTSQYVDGYWIGANGVCQ